MKQEVFKFIDGYHEYYMISNYGRVLSFKRGKPKFLKQIVNFKGYLVVDLYGNFKSKQKYIHRLVAKHFVENSQEKESVNHIDLDKKNNNVDNLEWLTLEENVYHYLDN